jgi:hypothetical protein
VLSALRIKQQQQPTAVAAPPAAVAAAVFLEAADPSTLLTSLVTCCQQRVAGAVAFVTNSELTAARETACCQRSSVQQGCRSLALTCGTSSLGNLAAAAAVAAALFSGSSNASSSSTMGTGQDACTCLGMMTSSWCEETMRSLHTVAVHLQLVDSCACCLLAI